MSVKRTLCIVRHAKSSWDIEGVSDIDRPLKFRGIRAAYEMARRIKIDRCTPELLISSPANRAMHTASIFMRVFEQSFENFVINDKLYGWGRKEILELIANQSDNVRKIMIFGHNPDFSEVASKLSGESFLELPTCGICRLSFKMDHWSSISHDHVVDFAVDFPKKGVEA